MNDTTLIDVAPQHDATRGSSGTLAALWLLTRRRMWRDRWLVTSSAVIVALATALSLAGPALVAKTVDDGAADAVTAAGPGADILVTMPIGNDVGDNVSSVRGLAVDDFSSLGQTVLGNLPRRTASVVSGYDAWVLSSSITVAWFATPDAVAARAKGEALETSPRAGNVFQFGYAEDAAVTLVDGRLPEPPAPPEQTTGPGAQAPPIEIAISAEVADTFGIGLGYHAQVATAVGARVELAVVGIVEPADPTADVWSHFPEVTQPITAKGAGLDLVRGTIMVSRETFTGLSRSLRTPFPGTVRVTVDPHKLTLNLASSMAAELHDLPGKAKELAGPQAGVNVTVKTALGTALGAYPARARAALAQMSIIIAGVVSVAAVVVALMASLMLTRRESDIALERARGSSVTSTCLRLGLESVLVTAAGLAVGVATAVALAPRAVTSSSLVWAVALVSALSAPLLGAARARAMWSGRREAANRQDRAKVAKGRRTRRLTLEALALVVAAAAVVSLRGRGVLQTATTGVDPFLAATPVLVALAIVVIVVRLYPLPMALTQSLARRTRGVAGVITLAKARERIPVLPLLALTLSIGIATAGGLLVSTVQAGQEQASWDRVGADVRVDAEITDDQAARLEDKGLLVSRGLYKPSATISFGGDYSEANLLAMDAHYPDILARAGVADIGALAKLFGAPADEGQPTPALASQELIDVDVHKDSSVYVGRTYVRFDIVGLPDVTPDGWTDGPPYLIMPLAGLMANEFKEPVTTNVAFVSGPGAAQAIAAEPSIDPSSVTTRQAWLAATKDSALIGGVERAIGIAVLAVGLLAAVALLVTILRGVRERGRALSMLRTQGMGSGYGWWLALAELAPLALAAVIGGGAAGLAIMAMLGDTLGLRLLSGGLADPPLAANWTFLGIVGGGVLVLLFLAVAAEVLAHRRNKLSDVLRWGESR